MGIIRLWFCASLGEAEREDEEVKAKVIWMDGEVREYRSPVMAHQVVAASSHECFICSSDTLYFDQPIPPLRPLDELRGGEIYFALPTSNLKRPLSASDMAALALRATAALDNNNNNKNVKNMKKKKKKKHSRISPHLLLLPKSSSEFKHPPEYDCHVTINNNVRSSSAPIKLHRLASRRAKLAVRSFRRRLSTIYES